MSWKDYEPTRPRKARGGIKARSKRGAFAESWWGKRWIETLESFHLGARLTRGKTYARKGQVTDLQIRPGVIEARVQGSRRKPYTVEVAVAPLAEEQWERVAEALRARPLLAAELLSGNVAEEVEEVFDEAGASLLPGSFEELESDCSCPDWSNPCKHIAAVFFLVAEALDRDPFLLFTLRGMEREELLGSLGDTPEIAVEPDPEPVPLAADPEAFWKGAELPARPQRDEGPPMDGALLRRLGPIPFWRGDSDPAEELLVVYRTVAREARSALHGEEE